MSVWVEMITFSYFSQSARRHAPRERVSWNCRFFLGFCQVFRHAPRERVSWNDNEVIENSTVNVTLHVSVWVEIWKKEKISKILICHAPRERVSWNCRYTSAVFTNRGHAPRERVSWNLVNSCTVFSFPVTLHVSVWVEIRFLIAVLTKWQVTLHVSVWVEMTNTLFAVIESRSRSTWACELKFAECVYPGWGRSHAPRERVSWNF